MGAAVEYPAAIEAAAAPSRIVLVCEHAANVLPPPWSDLVPGALRDAHVAWDPGALGVARGLARHLGAALVHAPISRLVHDLNRAPDHPGAMPARSEIHDIPGNADIAPAERAARTAAVYAPFHAGLAGLIAQRIALGQRPVIVTVHSFTPLWHGQPRAVEFGVIHDDTLPGDDRLARAVLAAAQRSSGLVSALNQPYSAADGVTHLLRRQAVPFNLPHAMLEIRNDLIATPEAEAAMADLLAPLLAQALAEFEEAR